MTFNSNDPFGDVENQLAETRGVLDGEAFRDREKVTEQITPQGVSFFCNCQGCEGRYKVDIGWSELITASCGAAPLDPDSRRPWIKANGYLYPPVGCGRCATMLSIPITPDQAQRLIITGIKMGAVAEQDVMKARQSVQMQIQQQQRR